MNDAAMAGLYEGLVFCGRGKRLNECRVGGAAPRRYVRPMMPTTRVFAGFALIVSAAVLGGALASQYWGGLMPCELCLLERWPWRAAIVIALVALLVGHRALLPWAALLLTLVYTLSIAFAAYHVGVEQHWFAGPAACTAAPTGAMTLEQMKAQILGTPAVMCDKVQWSLFGVSLAGWNLVASFGMATLCAIVFALTWRRATRRPAPA
ncbi:MAG TPA: disulfide bond formation protein B [Stellaceae bacterium]|nr:disulfide bond formation protein B [Stellaceae bacterium]